MASCKDSHIVRNTEQLTSADAVHLYIHITQHVYIARVAVANLG